MMPGMVALLAAWLLLIPGAEYAQLGPLHAVRIDAAKARFRLALGARDGGPRTAGQWADDRKFAVVMNAGMFAPDGSLTGYARDGTYESGQPPNKMYKMSFGFGGPSGAALLDLEAGALPPAGDYPSLVQNLRLLKTPGVDVWAHAKPKRWSEAAVAQDADGRILFVFSRQPFTMTQFNHELVSRLGAVRAMHVEGGPEASLSIHTQKLRLDLCGSYESGFREDDTNGKQWPIPNVLGIASQSTP